MTRSKKWRAVTRTKVPSVPRNLCRTDTLPFSVVPTASLRGYVVAIDPVSVDADRDNGAILHDPARLWQRDYAAPRVTQRTSEGVKAEQTAATQHAARRMHAPV